MQVLRVAAVVAAVVVGAVASAQTRTKSVTYDGRNVSVVSFTVFPGDVDGAGAALVRVCAEVVSTEDPAQVLRGCEAVRLLAPWTQAKALKAWRAAQALEEP